MSVHSLGGEGVGAWALGLSPTLGRGSLQGREGTQAPLLPEQNTSQPCVLMGGGIWGCLGLGCWGSSEATWKQTGVAGPHVAFAHRAGDSVTYVE